jgi:hypothetical protein
VGGGMLVDGLVGERALGSALVVEKCGDGRG